MTIGFALQLVTVRWLGAFLEPGAEDPDDWRDGLLSRYQTVIGFLKMLPSVISFGASVISFGAIAEGAPVLAAMRACWPPAAACRPR